MKISESEREVMETVAWAIAYRHAVHSEHTKAGIAAAKKARREVRWPCSKQGQGRPLRRERRAHHPSGEGERRHHVARHRRRADRPRHPDSSRPRVERASSRECHQAGGGALMKIAILSAADVSSWYGATLMERGHQITFGPFCAPLLSARPVREGIAPDYALDFLSAASF
jgi:hypothetical protein